MKKFKLFIGILSAIAILTACNSEDKYSFEEVKNSQIDHVHGLGYTNGGEEFVVATHYGLYQYGNDGWQEANSEKHDYMGFSAVREGFYASGHPEKGSKLKNPLGLIKSTDRGATLEQLAFYGEIDFHYLTAGYDSNAVYVFNETPTEKLKGGLNYSLDEGKTWTQATMNGLSTTYISNFAAHPSKEELLLVGSKEGIYISTDYGQNFSILNSNQMVTYVTLNEAAGYYTNFDNNKVHLKSFSLEKGSEKNIELPEEIMTDPIIFIALNPNNEKEIVIITNNLNIYQSKDQGLTWDNLAFNGKLTSNN
ncbi:F510_1955 family glycosylhydrolase [Solibacillus sp. FSL R7-0668]|uniref:F510_1955 family glycosylhydrolase n=1 Tax=Solibacillus sp. FSL R7-0668 TaxID=2921688 RepID=UPI0030F7F0C1